MKKILALVLALALACTMFAACAKTPATDETTAADVADETTAEAVEETTGEAGEEDTTEAFDFSTLDVMSYDEFMAAELEAPVAFEAFIQAKTAYAEAYSNCSLYLQGEDGGFYAYRVPCTAEEYESFEAGKKVKVTGYKTEWSGEVEIAEGTAKVELLDGEDFIFNATDVTELLGTDDLQNEMNKFVAFKGLTVAAKTDADGNEVAFLYNWDGSGEKGSDLYFDVTLGENTYTFTVESDLCGADTDVYAAVEALQVGDVIDAEGFLYWYNGANPHITSVTAAA